MARIDTAPLIRLIAEAAAPSDDGDAMLERFCLAMRLAGIPVSRVNVSMPALDPMASSLTIAWTDDEGVSLSRTAHGEEYRAPFLRSPIRALIEADLTFGRWRLTEPPEERFTVLHEYRDAGATDYLLHLVSFTPGTALRGVAMSFLTRQSGGFDQSEVTAVADLVPVLGLAMCKIALSFTLRRTLGIYLGSAAGAEVLSGRITRGESRSLPAAILLADLRGFTALTDRSDPVEVVGWLDEHFEALGEPVTHHGGEILKFLGDGFLAVFPVGEPDRLPCRDCERALEAALAARDANVVLNKRREARGLPQLDADLVLHFGEVMYGNVGTRRRLDFTIIGRAVNEASRMEKHCDVAGHAILISDTFAARCRRELMPLGLVPLRGLERPQQIWTLAESVHAADVRRAGDR